MAQVVFVAEAHVANTSDNATTTTISKPSGVVDGDLMIAILNIGANSSTVPTPPAGWTLLDSDTHGASSPNTYVYRKVASSEGASYVWTHGSIGTGGSQGSSGAIIAFRNAYTAAAPLYTKNYDSAADTTASGSALTVPAAPGGFLVAFVATAVASITTSGYTVANNNPTWVEDSDEAAGTKPLAVAHAPYDLAQDTGGFTATLSGSSVAGVYLIAIVPAAHTISPPVAALTGTLLAPTANVTVTMPVVAATATLLAPTVAQTSPTWTPTAKPTETVWTPADKP